MKIGIIKETKTPPDKRVPFSPSQCKQLQDLGLEVVVQPSDIRSYSDEEYLAEGIELKEDLSDCDYLFGVKEVQIPQLMEGKKYFFFSHTIKEQPYNKVLMQALIEKKIQMIDYECLQNTSGQRLLGFGRYAGIVGAYNALAAWGLRSGHYELKPANLCLDIKEVQKELLKIQLSGKKILLTGGGRVANGAIELLDMAGIQRVEKMEYCDSEFHEAVYCVVDCNDYYFKPGADEFDFEDFYQNSESYEVNFLPYLNASDIFISGHYWDNKSKVLFTADDTRKPEFKTKVIADITCDIKGSVPTTLRPSTIDQPIYGYNKEKEEECDSFNPDGITIMAVDNLPCELPRDASADFGSALLEKIIPEIVSNDQNGIINKASICIDGQLNSPYDYLHSYAFD